MVRLQLHFFYRKDADNIMEIMNTCDVTEGPVVIDAKVPYVMAGDDPDYLNETTKSESYEIFKKLVMEENDYYSRETRVTKIVFMNGDEFYEFTHNLFEDRDWIHGTNYLIINEETKEKFVMDPDDRKHARWIGFVPGDLSMYFVENDLFH